MPPAQNTSQMKVWSWPRVTWYLARPLLGLTLAETSCRACMIPWTALVRQWWSVRAAKHSSHQLPVTALTSARRYSEVAPCRRCVSVHWRWPTLTASHSTPSCTTCQCTQSCGSLQAVHWRTQRTVALPRVHTCLHYWRLTKWYSNCAQYIWLYVLLSIAILYM